VIPGNDDAIRAVELYAAGVADAVLAGREAMPQMGGSEEDEFVELDESGRPKARRGRRKGAPAPRKAPVAEGEAAAPVAAEGAPAEAAHPAARRGAPAARKKTAVRKKAGPRKAEGETDGE